MPQLIDYQTQKLLINSLLSEGKMQKMGKIQV